MRSARLLSALLLLQAHGRLSTREIAERLEVSERTAHRDMEALSLAGIPLIAFRGAHGGWELARGWRTKVPGLDDTELQALLMAQPSALGDRRLAAAAQRAIDKLMASLPAPMKMHADSLRARLHIDSSGWRMPTEDLTMLPAVQDALARDCKLSFFYTRADGEAAVRTVDPFGLVCKQTVWYLVARAPAGMRTYRISRMREATALAMHFERPVNFDLAQYWSSATERLREERQHIRVTLALSPKGVQSLNRWCLLVPVADHPMAKKLPNDWLIFDTEFENMEQVRFVTLGLGSAAMAVAPKVLVSAIRNEIRLMSSRTGGRAATRHIAT